MRNPIDAATCIVRRTADRAGWTRVLTPGATAARHLHVGRIVLGAVAPPVQIETGVLETGLVCLAGAAIVTVGGTRYTLAPYDAIYVPREAVLEIAPGPAGGNLVEIAAPVTRQHPVQFVRFEDVQRDPGLHFQTGGPNARRDLSVLLGKNVDAGRILAGVTFSEPGHWTSWPPHEHAAMLEEAYLYIAMPPPSFGVQLVYTNTYEPELATVVRQDDLVLMPRGYHPNVAAPANSINFVWMMAAHREDVDRQFGVVNVQPEFAATSSGLDRGRSESR